MLAAPAAAHGPTATQAGYVSNVNAVLPNVLGLSANVVGGDVWLRLSNYSGKEIVILGYQGEPYLRFGHDEVFQNTRAPTTYVNRFRGLHARVPATASATAPPAWEKVADGASFKWRDHRIYWVREEPPPGVKANPDLIQRIFALARPGPGRRPALRDHRHPRLPPALNEPAQDNGWMLARARRLGRARRARVGRAVGGPPQIAAGHPALVVTGTRVSVGQFGAVRRRSCPCS